MLSQTNGCPLARRLRRTLRRRNPEADVPCVYSDEPVDRSRIRPPGEVAEEQPERGRARGVMGSLPTMTGVFGLVLANEALRLLLGDLFPGAGR
jgi:tRNA A37 threonylcarbamoyladenosine dehydratase